jgi:hypothetical protein
MSAALIRQLTNCLRFDLQVDGGELPRQHGGAHHTGRPRHDQCGQYNSSHNVIILSKKNNNISSRDKF